MDYKYIRAWGIMMGSFEYYINGEIQKAKDDNAPTDAIYKKDGVWATFSEIKSEDTKKRVAEIVESFKR